MTQTAKKAIEMDLRDGTDAVRAARLYAEAETKLSGKSKDPAFGDRPPPKWTVEPKGVFVTISEYPSGDLRGCIGYPEPIFPLGKALRMSAEAACHDPRFDDLTYEETQKCTFEVTVLSVPQRIEYRSPEELLSKIVIGRDGLILSFKGRRGLLLPQVPVEWEWGPEEFLEHLSMKAGLRPETWKEPGVTVESFNGEIFTEASPKGEVVRK
ncbi:hypothetical protein Mpt1_c08350 [Candidatus Methanoplasma termitum]|uniref:AMMECR1 domain-containing protein n=1 Tax=Candidatus Methanoplasma termitum TaxID=1577791 RepID=A0A0A7LEH9_9ARCH|nr:TIGR00296 family protein [Candidatus Methanoplasma termitum]AIZ56712.1 hypothetical protein Mpt1_c08350 [Candidatus Methanoplasma termitum]MCL2333354.1 TIGR00296 family protein [Candidatus Methanoplasma sp.]